MVFNINSTRGHTGSLLVHDNAQELIRIVGIFLDANENKVIHYIKIIGHSRIPVFNKATETYFVVKGLFLTFMTI